MTYLSFTRLVKSMKCQILYRLTEILSFYEFLRPDSITTCHLLLGLLRVSEYSDIHGSNKKFEYEYSSLPKSVDRDLFFFFFLTTETSGFSVKLARQMSCKVNLKSNNNESLTMANL